MNHNINYNSTCIGKVLDFGNGSFKNRLLLDDKNKNQKLHFSMTFPFNHGFCSFVTLLCIGVEGDHMLF